MNEGEGVIGVHFIGRMRMRMRMMRIRLREEEKKVKREKEGRKKEWKRVIDDCEGYKV